MKSILNIKNVCFIVLFVLHITFSKDLNTEIINPISLINYEAGFYNLKYTNNYIIYSFYNDVPTTEYDLIFKLNGTSLYTVYLYLYYSDKINHLKFQQ